MRLIVGLRNPGPAYAGTRHNVGAAAVEEVVSRAGVKLRKARLGIRADVAEVGHGDGRSILALPRSFMNESGSSVAPLLRYYRVPVSHLVLVHDDIDLPFGRLRAQPDRGAGGHNGVESVIRSLGGKEFWRIKLGVGRPPGSLEPADFVLRRFNSSESEAVALMIEQAADLIELTVGEGPEAARQRAGEMWVE